MAAVPLAAAPLAGGGEGRASAGADEEVALVPTPRCEEREDFRRDASVRSVHIGGDPLWDVHRTFEHSSGSSNRRARLTWALVSAVAALALVGIALATVGGYDTGITSAAGNAQREVLANARWKDELGVKELQPADPARLGVGWKLWVKSQSGHRRLCTIIEAQGDNIRIHYDSFATVFDEWLTRDSPRIVALASTTTLTTTSRTTTSSTQTTTTQTSSTRTSTLTSTKTFTFTTSTVTTTTITSSTSSTFTSSATTTTSSTTRRQYISLLCFTLARSDNEELTLVRLQLEKRIGIYDCDVQVVYSDVKTWLSQGPTYLRKQSDVMIQTEKLPVNFKDAKTEPHAAWLNAKDYMLCWQQIVQDTRVLWHDYVVKVDPDTVLLPGRLREGLRTVSLGANRAVYFRSCKSTPRKCVHTVTVTRSYGADWQLKVTGTSTDKFAISPVCSVDTPHGENCKAHNWGDGVHVVVDQNNRTIGEGNCCNEVESIASTDSDCPQQQTERPEPGLSGALEVISREAVDRYGRHGQRCLGNHYGDVGEEFFMEECLKLLGVTPLSGPQLLADEFCGSAPGGCRGTQSAFHPLKTPEEFVQCAGAAMENLLIPELHANLLNAHVPTADG